MNDNIEKLSIDNLSQPETSECISGTVFPKILTKKQKNILSLVLELKDFNFVNLIQEKDLIVLPENMPNGVLHIDFEVFRNCFSSDAFEMLKLNLEEKKKLKNLL